MATLITPASVHGNDRGAHWRETEAQEHKGQRQGHTDGWGRARWPLLYGWNSCWTTSLTSQGRLRWEFSAQPFLGHFPAQNYGGREAFQAQGAGSGDGFQGGRGPGGVTTHKRTVEAARRARSRRPAREERMDVITIMSPLRRPGHVSMEPGGFPAHTAMLRGCPWTPGQSPSPMLIPKAGCSPPRTSVHLRGASVPCSLDHPSFQPPP